MGDSDPQFTELFRAALGPYDEMLVARIREDVRGGVLRPDLDADGVVSLLLGAGVSILRGVRFRDRPAGAFGCHR